MTALPQLPEARLIDADGCRLAYYIAGPDDGRPLVICHGLAAGALQFADDMAYFADRGYRVIAPDLRGHGQSAVPFKDDGTAYAISRLADDLLRILDAEGITRTDWVGNSLGGIIALDIMGRAPERLNRVVVFGTAFALDLPGLVVHGLALGYAAIGRPLLSRITAHMTCPGARARKIVYQTLLAARPEAVKGIAAHVRRYDLTANAQGFENPFLMIRADRDKAVNLALPASIAAMAGRETFRLAHIKDAGHCANLDQPEAFRRIVLAFLNPDGR